MKHFTHSLTVMGTVRSISQDSASFIVSARSGDLFTAYAGPETNFQVCQNVDKVDHDCFVPLAGVPDDTPGGKIVKYLREGDLIATYGVFQKNDERTRYDVRTVNILKRDREAKNYLFETTHWWQAQITGFADTWLYNLFGTTEKYDFTKYQTNIGITGMSLENDLQECATLSRLIYGLSSAYLITGCDRYLDAARQGVVYQRENFRSISHDGQHIFWAHGKDRSSRQQVFQSVNGDDNNTIPLYEQIYALAGLAQFYRITNDWETLNDIMRTVKSFNTYFKDNQQGGYFSHVDPSSFYWDTPRLGINRAKKNWNSIGDHIPAYLINIILALEPSPVVVRQYPYQEMLATLKTMLEETSELILDKFPDPDPQVPYVNERFFRDWRPDHEYSWQQNRGIIGHNLKIAWNLIRVANYYHESDPDKALRCEKLADTLAGNMIDKGVDLVRGGIFDCVAREPANDMPIDFTWGNTKDFWQQEQAILAYQIVYGHTGNQTYLGLAQEMAAFWNLYYLDKDFGGFYFRVRDDGNPIVAGIYADKGGHAISGYHAFELNYLAHVYTRTYLRRENICLYFRPQKDSEVQSVNILPDFVKPRTYKIVKVTIDGIEKVVEDPFSTQIRLTAEEMDSQISVELSPVI
ncbi:N-acyl-D-glucosamine 2-epimerase [Marinilabiliaceae bacterium JC017]|nr:N-acyl-D-glucosamine 2-epimerase [Marinilabiliaceae bacterium JC017]